MEIRYEKFPTEAAERRQKIAKRKADHAQELKREAKL
jgi:hypothetical protein